MNECSVCLLKSDIIHYLAQKSKNDTKKALKMEDADNVRMDISQYCEM